MMVPTKFLKWEKLSATTFLYDDKMYLVRIVSNQSAAPRWIVFRKTKDGKKREFCFETKSVKTAKHMLEFFAQDDVDNMPIVDEAKV